MVSNQTALFIIDHFFSKLKPQSKEAIVLVMCEGWSKCEAAIVCDVSHQSVVKNTIKFDSLLKNIQIAHRLISTDKCLDN